MEKKLKQNEEQNAHSTKCKMNFSSDSSNSEADPRAEGEMNLIEEDDAEGLVGVWKRVR